MGLCATTSELEVGLLASKPLVAAHGPDGPCSLAVANPHARRNWGGGEIGGGSGVRVGWSSEGTGSLYICSENVDVWVGGEGGGRGMLMAVVGGGDRR